MSQGFLGTRDVAGFVLAGGRSSRMGADKALQVFRDKPLISSAIEILKNAGLEPSIAGARSDLSAHGPVIPDAQTTQGEVVVLGPLGGICSALSASDKEFAVFLPVDMPLIPPDLIRLLLENALMKGAHVTMPSTGGFAQTFPVVVQWSALPVLSRELTEGRRGCFAALRQAAEEAGKPASTIPVEVLVQTGHVADSAGIPPHLWFLNVNTPEDLAQAESIQVRRIA